MTHVLTQHDAIHKIQSQIENILKLYKKKKKMMMMMVAKTYNPNYLGG
jgi:hypothetical protein